MAIRVNRAANNPFLPRSAMEPNMKPTRRRLLAGLGGAAGVALLAPGPAQAASARRIDHEADQALRSLYAAQPRARNLTRSATAILVFPRIIRAGFMLGGQTGDGVLIRAEKPVAYYNISAASFGLQAGAQRFSYALFFMNEAALRSLDTTGGWTVGSGPSIVVVDRGMAASMTSATLTQDIVAIPFGQRGLMAGLGIEGSKITRIHPGR